MEAGLSKCALAAKRLGLTINEYLIEKYGEVDRFNKLKDNLCDKGLHCVNSVLHDKQIFFANPNDFNDRLENIG